jgi:predicted transcriptional regulator
LQTGIDKEMATIKEEARKLLDRLPDEASWEDLMYEIYVRKKIAAGVAAAEAGKLIPHEEVRRRLTGQ